MLSYNNPITMNGQSPASPAISAGRQSIPPSPKLVRSPAPALSNGVASNAATANGQLLPARTRHIWLVTGPAGCGKSTVAQYLSNTLHWPYIEGDEFHPQANIDKMADGIPLTDADRWDWLTALREASVCALDQGNEGVVLTCSALKRKYRDVIRVAPYFMPNVQLHFIFLHAPEEVLLKRVMARQNHYMGANMVHSQFEVLEVPTARETDVIGIDVSRPLEDVMSEALDRVLHTMDDARNSSRN